MKKNTDVAKHQDEQEREPIGLKKKWCSKTNETNETKRNKIIRNITEYELVPARFIAFQLRALNEYVG